MARTDQTEQTEQTDPMAGGDRAAGEEPPEEASQQAPEGAAALSAAEAAREAAWVRRAGDPCERLMRAVHYRRADLVAELLAGGCAEATA